MFSSNDLNRIVWRESYLGVNPAIAILHAIADRPLVNIQPDVIHNLSGGASLVSLNQLVAEFSLCTPSAPPSTCSSTDSVRTHSSCN
jgi:hypothetical protein